jgi:hypothetical protein
MLKVSGDQPRLARKVPRNGLAQLASCSGCFASITARIVAGNPLPSAYHAKTNHRAVCSTKALRCILFFSELLIPLLIFFPVSAVQC